MRVQEKKEVKEERDAIESLVRANPNASPAQLADMIASRDPDRLTKVQAQLDAVNALIAQVESVTGALSYDIVPACQDLLLARDKYLRQLKQWEPPAP